MLEIKEYTIEDLKSIYDKRKNGSFYVDVWLKKYPVLKNQSVFLWISSKIRKYASSGKEPSKFNINAYLKALQDYCQYNKVENIDNLLSESVDVRNRRVLKYLNHLIEKGVNPVSVKNAYQSRIMSFYSNRGVPITESLKSEQEGVNHNEIDLDREKLQAILNQINHPEYRIIAYLQALTGLRVNDVLQELTSSIGNEPKYQIEKYQEHYYIKQFETYKEKEKIRYIFFPKELSNLIKSTYQIDDLTKLDLSKDFLQTRNGNNISSIEYNRKLKEVAKKLYPKERMRSHSLRKYFNTNCGRVNLSEYSRKNLNLTIGSEIELNFKEHLIGHRVHYSSKVYSKILSSREIFYNLWKALENELCINCEIVDNTSQEIESLQAKYNEMINREIEKDKIISELKDTIGFMSKFMLSLQNSFKEAVSDDSHDVKDDVYYTESEMKEFIERVNKLTNKD